MDNFQKMLEFAIQEIMNAEQYIKMANKFSQDENISLKFQSFAKESVKRNREILTILKEQLKKNSSENKYNLEDSLFYDIYEDWFESVEFRANNFKINR